MHYLSYTELKLWQCLYGQKVFLKILKPIVPFTVEPENNNYEGSNFQGFDVFRILKTYF